MGGLVTLVNFPNFSTWLIGLSCTAKWLWSEYPKVAHVKMWCPGPCAFAVTSHERMIGAASWEQKMPMSVAVLVPFSQRTPKHAWTIVEPDRKNEFAGNPNLVRRRCKHARFSRVMPVSLCLSTFARIESKLDFKTRVESKDRDLWEWKCLEVKHRL